MKKKPEPTAQTRRQAKKAIVLNAGRKNPAPVIIAISLIVTVTAALGFILMPETAPHGAPQQAATPTAATQMGPITHAASLFDDGQARHFHYADSDSGITINYFVLKSSDGVIRAAFDACDVCWPEGKGYTQDGDSMVCRNCGRRFASVMVNEVQGGCNPAPLNRTVKDGQVVIRLDDLLKGRSYFDFSKKV